jgi:hypothetical protein
MDEMSNRAAVVGDSRPTQIRVQYRSMNTMSR